MQERFPLPRFFICKPGDSNERKIKVRVNPSSLTANNATVEVIIYIILIIFLEWKLFHRRCKSQSLHATSYQNGSPILKIYINFHFFKI